jgi:hypothetical protein
MLSHSGAGRLGGQVAVWLKECVVGAHNHADSFMQSGADQFVHVWCGGIMGDTSACGWD